VSAESQFRVWRRIRRTGTIAVVSEESSFDSAVESIPASSSECIMGDPVKKAPLRTDTDDALLVRAALLGQVWAQREIWFRFSPMVYGLFRRALGPQHDHEDLTQEVFLRVFRGLRTLEKAHAIRSFVFSVAVRVVSEEVRRFAWRRRIIEQHPLSPEPLTCAPADFESREVMSRVRKRLDSMRDKHRAVFILRYVEGMDLRDISLGLGISRASAKRYLAKALAAIQKCVPQDETQTATHTGRLALVRLFEGGQ